jgi:murein L,D-transpeptidase YafK
MKKIISISLLFAFIAVSMVFFLNRGTFQPKKRVFPESATKEKVGRLYLQASLPGITTDRILIEKRVRRLTLFRQGKPIKTYRVALGRRPVGKKTREGDCRTPEGCYIIDYCNADSRFHRALHISYPNEEDKRRAALHGVSPGSDIMIHGLMNGMGWTGNRHLMHDWTKGCIAVTNKEMDEIWRMASVGTKVEIVP